MKINTNYHTHTYLCRHAVGTAEDYIKRAISCNYEEIGISDHGPISDELARRVVSRRMNLSQYKDVYVPELHSCIEKYGDQISILKAVEIEYLNELKDFYPMYLKDMDYLVLGQHYFNFNNEIISTYDKLSDAHIDAYADTIVKALETNQFKILAHPDLYLWGYNQWNDHAIEVARKIILAAKRNNVLLEFNANGIRTCLRKNKYVDQTNEFAYPNVSFFKLVKEYDMPVIIDDDAHDPLFIHDEYTLKAYSLAEELGLKIVKKIF